MVLLYLFLGVGFIVCGFYFIGVIPGITFKTETEKSDSKSTSFGMFFLGGLLLIEMVCILL
jgi:hypothetical protein